MGQRCLFLFFLFGLRFPYLDHPEERLLLEALKQLYQFDAIDRLVAVHLKTFIFSPYAHLSAS